jgi:hypothetical protein
MKVPYLLLIVVAVLSVYLFSTTAAIFQGILEPACTFWPDCDCLAAKFKALSGIHKQQLLSVVHLDYVYLIFYPFLLGIWTYREMQLQSSLWLNTWLRFSLLIVLILCLTDITENILLGLLLNGISYPFKTLAIVTRLKWISLAFILLSLLIGLIGRKTGLFPLSLRLTKPI